MGFRPLYLLAGTFAALSILGWIAQFTGWMGGHVYIRGPLWHAHEMIFGFALTVVVGSLSSAGSSHRYSGRLALTAKSAEFISPPKKKGSIRSPRPCTNALMLRA